MSLLVLLIAKELYILDVICRIGYFCGVDVDFVSIHNLISPVTIIWKGKQQNFEL